LHVAVVLADAPAPLPGAGPARGTLVEVFLADSLQCLRRFEEAKGLLRKKMTVARRVLGGSDILFVKMRCIYAAALYKDNGATLDDLREAVAMIEDTDRIARRLLGSAHPVVTTGIDGSLRNARAALRARETPPSPPAV